MSIVIKYFLFCVHNIANITKIGFTRVRVLIVNRSFNLSPMNIKLAKAYNAKSIYKDNAII